MSKAVAGFTRTTIAQSRVQRANQETTVFFDVGDLNPSQLMSDLLTIARNFAFMLTLYTLISECIISILFFIQFLRYRQGEFVYRSKAFFVGDHFLYSHDLNV